MSTKSSTAAHEWTKKAIAASMDATTTPPSKSNASPTKSSVASNFRIHITPPRVSDHKHRAKKTHHLIVTKSNKSNKMNKSALSHTAKTFKPLLPNQSQCDPQTPQRPIAYKLTEVNPHLLAGSSNINDSKSLSDLQNVLLTPYRNSATITSLHDTIRTPPQMVDDHHDTTYNPVPLSPPDSVTQEILDSVSRDLERDLQFQSQCPDVPIYAMAAPPSSADIFAQSQYPNNYICPPQSLGVDPDTLPPGYFELRYVPIEALKRMQIIKQRQQLQLEMSQMEQQQLQCMQQQQPNGNGNGNRNPFHCNQMNKLNERKGLKQYRNESKFIGAPPYSHRDINGFNQFYHEQYGMHQDRSGNHFNQWQVQEVNASRHEYPVNPPPGLYSFDHEQNEQKKQQQKYQNPNIKRNQQLLCNDRKWKLAKSSKHRNGSNTDNLDSVDLKLSALHLDRTMMGDGDNQEQKKQETPNTGSTVNGSCFDYEATTELPPFTVEMVDRYKVRFLGVYRGIDQQEQIFVLMSPQHIVEFNQIAEQMADSWDWDMRGHGSYFCFSGSPQQIFLSQNLEIVKQHTGWSVQGQLIPFNPVCVFTFDFRSNRVVTMRPVLSCGVINNVMMKPKCIWVTSALRVFALEKRVESDNQKADASKCGEIVEVELFDYRKEVYNMHDRNSYMVHGWKDFKGKKGDKVTFCMKLSTKTNKRVKSMHRPIFVQAWNLRKQNAKENPLLL